MQRFAFRVAAGVCIALILGLVQSSARAYPAVVNSTFSHAYCGAVTTYSSLSALCTAAAPRMAANYLGSCSAGVIADSAASSVASVSLPNLTCTINVVYNGTSHGARTFGVTSASSGPSCPNGGTLAGSVCNCVATDVDTGTACVTPEACTAPKFLPVGGTTCQCVNGYKQQVSMNIFGYQTLTKPTSGAPCVGGCGFIAGASTQWQDGKWYSELLGGTGQACTNAVPAPSTLPQTPTQPETDCVKKGGVGGTVNGQFVCLDKKTGGVPSETVNPGAPTNRTVTDNGDGTSTVRETKTNTTTDCSGAGSCVTNTTTTTTTTIINNTTGAPIGTPRSEVRTDGPKPTTPEGNRPCDPGEQDCEGKEEEEETAFGGSCSGFTCNGDAIQCAIAQEQHKRNCEFLTDKNVGLSRSDAEKSYNNLKGPAAGDKILETAAGTGGSVSSLINSTDRINAGSDLGVVNIVLPIGTFAMDLTIFNDPLKWFGLIIVSCSLLIAARIVMGAL